MASNESDRQDIDYRLDAIAEKLDAMNKKIDEVKVSLFGVEGHGGLHKWVSDINARVSALEADYNISKGRLVGVCVGVSSFISIVTFLVTYFVKR